MTTDLDAYRTLLAAVLRRWRATVRIVAAATVVMLVYVLIMPQQFSSSVSLLPPQKDSNPLSLSSMMQGGSQSLPMMDLGATFGFGGRPADLFVEILNSISVSDSLIRTEHLAPLFGVPDGRPYMLAMEPLREATEVSANKNGIIHVTVTLGTGYFASDAEIDSVKRQAAHLANMYVVWLDRINREKLVSRAKNSRLFIEQEIARTRGELDSAFNALVAYQETHQSAYIDKQMEAVLGSASSLRTKIAAAESELALKKRDFSERSRVISQIEAEIGVLTKQYDALSSGKGKESSDYFVPFSRIPAVARDLANLLRQVKTLEQVTLYLSQQYYQDKVQEARDTPTVQVLDAAVPAIRRASPRRALWLMMTVFFSALFAVSYVMLDEYRAARRRIRSDHGAR